MWMLNQTVEQDVEIRPGTDVLVGSGFPSPGWGFLDQNSIIEYADEWHEIVCSSIVMCS